MTLTAAALTSTAPPVFPFNPVEIAVANLRESLNCWPGHLAPRVTPTDLTAVLDHLENLEFEISRLKGTSHLGLMHRNAPRAVPA